MNTETIREAFEFNSMVNITSIDEDVDLSVQSSKFYEAKWYLSYVMVDG